MDATARKPYPSDLTDGQWELLAIVIPNAKPGGRPRSSNMREIVNAMLYLNRTGCQWDMLPHDLPPKSTVYEYFAAWRDDGTWQHMLDVPRGLEPTAKTPGNPAIFTPGGAESGAHTPIDADLSIIVAAWPTLPEPTRAAILGLVGTVAPTLTPFTGPWKNDEEK